MRPMERNQNEFGKTSLAFVVYKGVMKEGKKKHQILTSILEGFKTYALF